ncbi:MAG TPA: hypothetical protein VH416_02620 [Gaiellaceae bacterium]|jgi:predicted secreted Zn-dependent protease
MKQRVAMLSLVLLAGVVLAELAGARAVEIVLLLALSASGFAYLFLRLRERGPDRSP